MIRVFLFKGELTDHNGEREQNPASRCESRERTRWGRCALLSTQSHTQPDPVFPRPLAEGCSPSITLIHTGRCLGVEWWTRPGYAAFLDSAWLWHLTPAPLQYCQQRECKTEARWRQGTGSAHFSETAVGPVLALPALTPDNQLRNWSLGLFLPHSLCFNSGLRVISLELLTLCVRDVFQVPGGLAQPSDLCAHSQH